MRALFLHVELFAIMVLFLGCSVHDVQHHPRNEINVTCSYSNGAPKAPDTQDAWYHDFNDTRLNLLIETALTQNYDVKQAIARVKQSRALARISDASDMPMLDFDAGGTYRFEKDRERKTYDVGLSLAWEADLFKRLENEALADTLEAQARAEELQALRLALSVEVAQAYYGVMAARNSLELLNEQVRLDEHYLELVMLRFQNGVGTTVEVLQQKSQLAQSESLIPTFKARLRSNENRLDVLLGALPDGVNRLDDIRPNLDVPVAQNIGIPSQLLQRRPDLRAMERRLVASDARIAVAIAQRLPSLRLGASLYRSDSVNYSGVLGIVSASFIQPLLDWGMREAEVKRNRALYEEQIAAYAARYLLAIEEVENTLYAQMQQRDYLERLEARRAILQLTVEEAQAQYLQGISDYLPVLNALEALDETERMMVQARFDLITYRLTLYRALGSSVSLNSTTKDPNP